MSNKSIAEKVSKVLESLATGGNLEVGIDFSTGAAVISGVSFSPQEQLEIQKGFYKDPKFTAILKELNKSPEAKTIHDNVTKSQGHFSINVAELSKAFGVDPSAVSKVVPFPKTSTGTGKGVDISAYSGHEPVPSSESIHVAFASAPVTPPHAYESTDPYRDEDISAKVTNPKENTTVIVDGVGYCTHDTKEELLSRSVRLGKKSLELEDMLAEIRMEVKQLLDENEKLEAIIKTGSLPEEFLTFEDFKLAELHDLTDVISNEKVEEIIQQLKGIKVPVGSFILHRIGNIAILKINDDQGISYLFAEDYLFADVN